MGHYRVSHRLRLLGFASGAAVPSCTCSHAAIISLLTSTASLQRFTVICYIVTYFVVANAMMVRRYLPGGSRLRCSRWVRALFNEAVG